MARLIYAIVKEFCQIVFGFLMLGVVCVIIAMSAAFFFAMFWIVGSFSGSREVANLVGVAGGFIGFCSACTAINNLDVTPVPPRGSAWGDEIKRWED